MVCTMPYGYELYCNPVNTVLSDARIIRQQGLNTVLYQGTVSVNSCITEKLLHVIQTVCLYSLPVILCVVSTQMALSTEITERGAPPTLNLFAGIYTTKMWGVGVFFLHMAKIWLFNQLWFWHVSCLQSALDKSMRELE